MAYRKEQDPLRPPDARSEKIDLRRLLPDPGAVRLIPQALATKFALVPLAADEREIRVAMRNPRDLEALDYLEMVTRRRPVPVLADETQIRELIQRVYGSSGLESVVSEASQLAKDGSDGSELPIIRLVDQILARAIEERATDIHLQPEESELVVRYRVDGALRITTRLPAVVHQPAITRVKVLSGLDISDRRLPQDGKFELSLGARRIDVRVSTNPTVFGENAVLRLLDHSAIVLDLEGLGFDPAERSRIDRLLARPNGIFLVTGPTGSGKTTTLYAALQSFDREQLNIMTLEDPVEYRLPGIRQSQILEKAGFTFGIGLRALMRQDPDVILVGEIRDLETAEIAMRASLTGHLVLSTLHTNGAIASLARLRDMGVASYLLGSTLCGVLAQRLVRRICDGCSAPVTPSPAEERFLGSSAATELRRGRGCSQCRETGYRGRFAIYELLEVTPDVSAMVASGGSEAAIEAAGRVDGFRTLREVGADRVRQGWTTVEEILRVTV